MYYNDEQNEERLTTLHQKINVKIKYNTSIMSLPPRVPTPYHDENGQSKGCK